MCLPSNWRTYYFMCGLDEDTNFGIAHQQDKKHLLLFSMFKQTFIGIIAVCESNYNIVFLNIKNIYISVTQCICRHKVYTCVFIRIRLLC